jgi:hypothetical protein
MIIEPVDPTISGSHPVIDSLFVPVLIGLDAGRDEFFNVVEMRGLD